MYVVLDGAHGIGKTTVCKELAKKKEFDYIPEVRDKLLPPSKLGPMSSEKLKGQLWFLRQAILKDQYIRYKSGVVLSDRGPISVLIYSKILLDEYEFELMKTLIESLNVKDPDLEIILWAPDEIIMKRIEQRTRSSKKDWAEDDRNYLKRINTEFKKYHEGFKDIKPLYLVDASGTLGETRAKIEEIIRKKFKI